MAAWYRRVAERRQGKLRAPPEIVGVVAKEGKRLRAGELRPLYLGGLLHHLPGLAVLDTRGREERSLEKQQREWDPDAPRRPRVDDRIDWLVHAVHHLYTLAEMPEPDREDEDYDGAGEVSRYDIEMRHDRGYYG
jgi:hypothetical protein